MKDSLTQARELLALTLGVAPDTLNDDASPDTHDGWDSLAHMRIILAIEEELQHELPSEAILEISTLKDIAVILAERRI